MILALSRPQPLNGNKMKRVLFVFFLLIGLQGFCQRYAKIGERAGEKYYIHKVADGETLYGIQNLYGVDMDKIQEANNLSETLVKGQRLYIPIRYHNVKHTVRNKETLYGISKKYSVPIDSLKAHNPDLIDGLKRGQQLVIKNLILSIELEPQADHRNQDSLIVEVQNTDQMLLNDSIVEYIVQQGETLYSISKRFMVPVEVLLNRNNLSSTTLKPNQTLTIPLKREMKIKPRAHILYSPDSTKQISNQDSLPYGKKFQALVFLPFNLDTIDVKGHRSYALEYYMGALLAVDSLKYYPVNVSFRFIDYLAKSMPFDSLLLHAELDSIDLIYAPFDFQLSEKLVKWSQGKSVKIIYPLASHHALNFVQDSLETALPTAYFMSPNTSALLHIMAKHISTRDSVQIVLIKTSDSSEIAVYKEFLRLTQYLDLPTKIQEATFSNYTYFSKKKGLKTVYVLLSKCSPKIDELLKFSSETENVEVYGLKEWKKCSSFLKSIENVKGYRFPNPSYLSYDDPEFKRIHRTYRKIYNSDMTKMACLGFDATLNMFLYAVYDHALPNGLVHKFRFNREGKNYMNIDAFMLEFKDLEENLIE